MDWLVVALLLANLVVSVAAVRTACNPSHRSPRPQRQRRKGVTASMRWEMAAAQDWKCAHCAAVLLHSCQVDHVTPLFLGGADSMDNMQMLCANCHASKTITERR